jgi:hypothetical protein
LSSSDLALKLITPLNFDCEIAGEIIRVILRQMLRVGFERGLIRDSSIAAVVRGIGRRQALSLET